MEERETISIEVAYARPESQVILGCRVPLGTTVEQAIEISNILQKFPEIDLAKNKVGIFGKLVKTDTVLAERDRVEIYRPLIADPKESRRKRAAKKAQTEDKA
jgi:putative ubiquitin-RnfH superfamily antitoxin RatB of RatAB toxin-antitoxin module